MAWYEDYGYVVLPIEMWYNTKVFEGNEAKVVSD